MPMAKKKQKTAERLQADGKSLVWATFSADEKQNLRIAAGIEGVPMSQFVRNAALAAAKKLVEKWADKQKSD